MSPFFADMIDAYYARTNEMGDAYPLTPLTSCVSPIDHSERPSLIWREAHVHTPRRATAESPPNTFTSHKDQVNTPPSSTIHRPDDALIPNRHPHSKASGRQFPKAQSPSPCPLHQDPSEVEPFQSIMRPTGKNGKKEVYMMAGVRRAN
jgi:hypothetical protein